MQYPTACSPQAWSTGAPLLFLRTMLGLEPIEDHLIVDPALPAGIGHLELLDIPGRWGRIDAFGRGTVDVDRIGRPRPSSACCRSPGKPAARAQSAARGAAGDRRPRRGGDGAAAPAPLGALRRDHQDPRRVLPAGSRSPARQAVAVAVARRVGAQVEQQAEDDEHPAHPRPRGGTE